MSAPTEPLQAIEEAMPFLHRALELVESTSDRELILDLEEAITNLEKCL